MKTLSLIILLVMSSPLSAGPRDAQWKQVQAAIDKGLPQTAITNLQPIILGALHDKAYAEAVKAIGESINLEGRIQGNKPEEKIFRLEAELARAPKEMAPVLETLLAHWYWQYFQQHRWQFLQRTATAQAPGKDFTAWDLPRLFVEIDRHFQKALAADTILKTTPVAQWNDLLEKGTLPDSYRPTLYDFLAHEALQFYTSGEQAGARPEDAVEVSADSPIFEPPDKFLAWTPAAVTGAQPLSPMLRAIQLYQALLRFHANDPEPRLAFGDVDLERLTWGNKVASGESKASRYKTALEAFAARNTHSELSTMSLLRQAQLLQTEDDLSGAHQLAQRGANLYPQSTAAKLCWNLAQELEEPSVSLSTEHVWNCYSGTNGSPGDPNQPCPAITLRYRNVGIVYFRAIPCDWETFLQRRYSRPENLSEGQRREILRKTPALEWSEKLPPTDYKDKTAALPAPTTLKPGFYFIASSHNPQFSDNRNQVSMTDVWVSDLALITRQHEGSIDGFVLDANSGEPLSGAQVSAWHLDRQGNRVADPTLATDANGFYSMAPDANRNYLLRARVNGREVATAGDVRIYSWPEPSEQKPSALTVFFTDRALYRPGQTVQYKGICLWVDQAKDNYDVLKGEEVTVIFRDPNGKEIARRQHRANDFGSFSGSFTAPRDRVTGNMSLAAEGRARGMADIQVEEYKRPKFEVTLDKPGEAARLNENVSLKGHAASYTGAAVDGAQVSYRVVREVRMPLWWGWWGRRLPRGESQEIAHGITRTEADGSFRLQFLALPDRKVAEKDEPTFDYRVHADVTDTAGETRSADQSIRIGYTALEANLTADEWQTETNPIQLKLETKSLDGEPRAASGSIKIYSLQAPDKVQRAELSERQPWRYRWGPMPDDNDNTGTNLSNPNSWPLGKIVSELSFATSTNGATNLSIKLPTGVYRAVLETQDRFGKKVTGKLPIQVLQPASPQLAIRIPSLLAAPEWKSRPDQEFVALWGTGYEAGRAFVEIEHRHQIVQRYWTQPGQTQQQIKLAVTEAMRGGFFVHVTQVRENRAYLRSQKVEVPWLNKDLELKWEHFTSKLQPNAKETWTLSIRSLEPTQRPAEREAAELVAALYDESLDAFKPQEWMHGFGVFRQDNSFLQPEFANARTDFGPVFVNWPSPHLNTEPLTYRSFPHELAEPLWTGRWPRYAMDAEVNTAMESRATPLSVAPPISLAGGTMSAGSSRRNEILDFVPAKAKAAAVAGDFELRGPGGASQPNERPAPDLSQVTARKNLNETAFFYPQLTSDSNGVVRLAFTMPEALTKWHFLGFAHDRSVRSGFLEDHAVTAKDLMVQPNPPRFLREGDTVEFTVKVSNQSDTAQTGVVRLTFNDALTDKPVDQALNVHAVPADGQPKPTNSSVQPFAIPAKESRSFAWRLTVPDGCGFLSYKAVGAAVSVSDGEEGAIPVLSRSILVTESLPLPIRGPGTKQFEFTKLLESGHSKTLRNQSLTVQMVSHPAWYAVLALPYLMEYPYECTEQTFNRLYANALARTIANRDPKIRRVFDLWKNTPALDSPLEKNQDLKSVVIEETPWLRQAQAESQARRNVGILFDQNRLDYETQALQQKLSELQFQDGWPWFPGGPRNDFITLYITTGFGRLRHLGADVDITPALRSLHRLDAWMSERFREIQKQTHPGDYVPSSTDALYLYGRSFFLKDYPVGAKDKPAVDFFLAQARKFWLQTGCRQTQGHLALALRRFSSTGPTHDPTPAAILASLKERSVTSEEMGRFWRDTEYSWWWYRAPIETQALMIEAFDEITGDQSVVEECRVWLLKQKQTQDWKTTKATADAVYALLLRGTELLSSDALVEVKLGGIDVTPKRAAAKPAAITPSRPEPGTGFYEVRFAASEVKPKLGDITVKKTDPGVAWGSAHWQYLEDMGKVTPHEGTPLKLTKALYVKSNTARGPMLEAVRGPIKVGDELVVRLELRVDRDMEYIHLKDCRGSGTEPVNVLSQYKYQDGLAYYESTRDTASHFFIDYLPKGTYVFEYSTRVQLRGRYQSGLAEIQCLYAPEFNSHAGSVELEVR